MTKSKRNYTFYQLIFSMKQPIRIVQQYGKLVLHF